MLLPVSARKVGPFQEPSTLRKAILGYDVGGKAFVGISEVERLACLDVFFHLMAESINGGLDDRLECVDFLFGKEGEHSHTSLAVEVVVDGPN